MSILPFLRKKKTTDTFEQMLSANAVKPAAANIEVTQSRAERGLRQWLYSQQKRDIDLLPDALLTEEFFYESQEFIAKGSYFVSSVNSIQDIVLTNASYEDYDNSCPHTIAGIRFRFQYTINRSISLTLDCSAVNSTRHGWQISQVRKVQ